MRKSKIVVILIFLAGITFSCQDFNEPQSRVVDTKDYAYEIDPNTIIENIDHGQKGVFKPVPFDYKGSVSVEKIWKQEDFFKVIDTLAETIFPDNFMQYRLDYLSADYECDAIGKTPRRIAAGYNLERKSGDTGQRERILFITIPDLGYIHVGYKKWQPLLTRRVTMDRQDIKVPFEEAIEIANKIGGQTFIDSHAEYCHVDITLFPKPGNKLVWQLRYQGPVINDYLEVRVDAVTGKAHKKNFWEYLFNK